MEELVKLLRQESYLHTGYENGGMYPLHPRARLRCHPRVANHLLRVFVPDHLLDATSAEEASMIQGIVVTVDHTMEDGSWQLVAGEGTI